MRRIPDNLARIAAPVLLVQERTMGSSNLR